MKGEDALSRGGLGYGVGSSGNGRDYVGEVSDRSKEAETPYLFT